jgi:protein-L-isoaspartate(D-aspartate) O-methyltransferase
MMVDTQVRPSDVTKFPIIDAMLDIPREAFVPNDKAEAAYIGENLHISDSRVLLEPRTLAKMLDALAVEPHHVALDIGCGLGYSTALLARLAEFVVAIEDTEEAAEEAQAILSREGFDNAAVMSGPLNEGAAKSGPYDIITLQGAVEDIPAAILDQLREGGRIAAIFAQNAMGAIYIGHKRDGQMSWRFAFNAGAPVLPGFEAEKPFSL